MILRARDNRKPSYPQFSIDTMRQILIPNFTVFPDAKEALAEMYERLKDATLLPFSMMNDDPVRRQIDDAVTEALGLDPEWVATIRRELAREPSITNRRYAGL